MSPFPEHILIVGPRALDVLHLCLLFEEVGFPGQLHTVPSVMDARAFLQRRGPYWKSPPVDLLVIDLSLPADAGEELIQTLAAQPLRPFIVALVPPGKQASAETLPVSMRCPLAPHHREVQAILTALEDEEKLRA
ncbi:hypothetical protein [Deinococcus hopiensis]|uniref:Response regulatory domain-containing protein n=1 Tax=Deinococcus hopiensis KR-140 TaxID=695939 RepID=A0A1W1UUV0_9DEIO|nr:hypothetical protein [Deinococcus hopiensis]SMB84591.1 hypothetical protein SAMN00790413_05207 [Deinococcus hopiensis KR-140]